MIKCKVQGKPSKCGTRMQVSTSNGTKHIKKVNGVWRDKQGRNYEQPS